jgi:plastocyanin
MNQRFMNQRFMNQRWNRRVVLALVLVAIMVAPFGQLGRIAGAQEATPDAEHGKSSIAAAQPATPVPGAQTWHVLVNNVSPDGKNWSFNTFYPDYLQAHPGDTIVFTLAPNPQAFHTVHILTVGMTPFEWYSGFSGGFIQSDLTRPGGWQSPYFAIPPATPCGRADQDPCLYNADDLGSPGLEFGLNSGVLVNPPPSGGEGNTSFTIVLDPGLLPGPYYVTSDVDGSTMSGRIDVVPEDQPVQSAGDVETAAQRQYEADLDSLAGLDRVSNPAEASNPDGTKTWQAAAGVSGSNKPWLSINAFGPSQMAIIAGDTVTWTNQGPGAVAHTVSGFAPTPDAVPDLSPYQPGCVTSTGELQLPPPGSFPPDIWNTCPGLDPLGNPNAVNNLTDHSQPLVPSGDPYTEGERTSGILLPQEHLDSPVGAGLPFESSYSVTFPNPGTYYYHCAIHPDMIGVVVVLPKPRAF